MVQMLWNIVTIVTKRYEHDGKISKLFKIIILTCFTFIPIQYTGYLSDKLHGISRNAERNINTVHNVITGILLVRPLHVVQHMFDIFNMSIKPFNSHQWILGRMPENGRMVLWWRRKFALWFPCKERKRCLVQWFK